MSEGRFCGVVILLWGAYWNIAICHGNKFSEILFANKRTFDYILDLYIYIFVKKY